MSSEQDSFAKGIFSTFAKGFLLHKLLLKVNYSPLRVTKSRSHDMGHCCVHYSIISLLDVIDTRHTLIKLICSNRSSFRYYLSCVNRSRLSQRYMKLYVLKWSLLTIAPAHQSLIRLSGMYII
jgi:hypothetical protein